MKKVILAITAALMAVSLTACGTKGSSGSDKEESKKLVVYSPNSEGLMNATIPLFEEKYGIKVEIIQAGTGELIKRLQSEKQDPYADVMFGGSFSQFYSNEDLFEEYVSENDQHVMEAYRNTTGFTTSYVLDGSVLIVNKDLIGDIEINGYEDLLNPALKGKIATADPANSSSAFAQLTNILKAMGGYDSDEAWKYVEELFTNIDGKIQSGSSAVYKSVADGEMVVGLTYEDPSAGLVRDGANVEVVYPEEGTVYLPATAAIVKDAKNMKNAKLFMDFIISEEVQNIYGTTLTNRPVREGAETGDYLTPIKDIKVIEEDIKYVNENKSAIVEKYTDIFTSIESKK
ncbi:MAG: extracellular solute-binding protein [Clostridiaceae bacterium]